MIAAQKSKEAEQERTRALDQRDQTMKLATTLAVDIDNSISRLAGSLPTRRLLINKGIEALEKVYATSPDDPKVLLELAAGYQSLGIVQRSRFASSLGDREGALKQDGDDWYAGARVNPGDAGEEETIAGHGERHPGDEEIR